MTRLADRGPGLLVGQSAGEGRSDGDKRHSVLPTECEGSRSTELSLLSGPDGSHIKR